MDTRADAATFKPASLDLQPVAVTRWTARLADPQCEHEFRLHSFADARRHAFFLMGLIAAASGLNFLVELHAYSHGATGFATLVPMFVSIWLPLFALAIALRIRSPQMLEALMVVCVAGGTVMRLSVLTVHSDILDMWSTLMVGIVFVIYLYLPVRLVAAVWLAVAFSLVAPVWWSLVEGGALPVDQFYRGVVWLLLANALGCTAANSLQRSQRMQFAQSLVMQQLLSTDSLTGIANRRRFDDALEREWRRCGRAGAPISLLMIDVDYFKAYNDHWGHQQGDDCLRTVARILVEAVGRPGDVVARYGGEEFVCLLPEIGPAGARAVAARLAGAIERAEIAHPLSPAGEKLTISIGVASATSLAGDPCALVALADKLLYAAKNAGRDQIAEGELRRVQVVVRAA
jgi:diguanylate cyclase (GGDEF)-like protein